MLHEPFQRNSSQASQSIFVRGDRAQLGSVDPIGWQGVQRFDMPADMGLNKFDQWEVA